MDSDVFVYVRNSEPDTAFMLKNGKLIVSITDSDSFEMSGKNLIFGAMEVLISEEEGVPLPRVFSIQPAESSEYVRIPAKTLTQMVKTYNVGFAIAKAIAENLVNVNEILTVKKEQIGEKERLSQEYCKIFAWVTDTLSSHYQKTRFPWLEPIVKTAKDSLTYHKGAAFSSFTEKSKFEITATEEDEFSKVFPKGSYVCKQGEVGEELYILKSGKLKVLINDNPITDIDDPGSVIGEMALLLREPRNATLQAIEDTVLTIVKKSNLKAFAEQNPVFLKNISLDLAKRVTHNCAVVKDLDDIFQQSKLEDDSLPSALRGDKYKEELKELKDKVKALNEKYDMDWLFDLVSNITEKMINVKK